MEDLRIKKLEFNMHSLNRRIEDHQELHAQDAIWKEKTEGVIHMQHETLVELQKQTAILLKVAPSIDSLAHYAEKTYEVFKPITTIAGYAIKLGTLSILAWHGVKWAMAKLVAVNI